MKHVAAAGRVDHRHAHGRLMPRSLRIVGAQVPTAVRPAGHDDRLPLGVPEGPGRVARLFAAGPAPGEVERTTG